MPRRCLFDRISCNDSTSPDSFSIFVCALSMVASRSCNWVSDRVVFSELPCRLSFIRSCISVSARWASAALSASFSVMPICTAFSRASTVWMT